MTLLLIALFVAIAAATGFVLADSGLRMWSALGAIKAQQVANGRAALPMMRGQRTAHTVTRVSFARIGTVAPQRAAA